MNNYRKTSHTTYDIKYHIVWITKYRKPILTGRVSERVRELTRQICKDNDVHIMAGHISKDHVHMMLSVPPHLSPSKIVQYIKGTTSRKLLQEFKELSKALWGQHLWARGYFVATSGNITDEAILEYIQKQDMEEKMMSDNFTIGKL